MTQLAQNPTHPQPVLAAERPFSTLRFDWMVTISAIWFIFGLYLDGWAHNNLGGLESFFTPWHAVFYSGFGAVTAVHGWQIWQNWRQGHGWKTAVPAGYTLSLLGIAIFAAGGVGDLAWHTVFGIEENIAALFSPTHLTLIAGMVLIVTGPIRALGQRRGNPQGWLALFPMLLSLTFLFSLLTFITQFAYFPANPWLATSVSRVGFTGQASQILGVLTSVFHSALLMGLLLPVVRRWRVPFGTVTLILSVNILLMSWMLDDYTGVPALVLAGLIGDGLLLGMGVGGGKRPFAFHLFAFLLPAILYALFLLTLTNTGRVWWVIHLITGIPIFTGCTGLLLSYLVLPPPSLQTKN